MTQRHSSQRLTDLMRLLDEMGALHEKLMKLVDARSAAMRRADVQAMRTLLEQEKQLVQHIQQREGLRQQLLDLIGEEVGLGPHASRVMTASQLAQRLVEPQRSLLLSSAQKLQAIVARVARANGAAGTLARAVLDHLRCVFDAVTSGLDGTEAYAQRGLRPAPVQARILEVLG